MQEFELNTTIIRPEPDECDLAEEQDDKPQQKEKVCPYCGNSGCYICLSHDEF